MHYVVTVYSPCLLTNDFAGIDFFSRVDMVDIVDGVDGAHGFDKVDGVEIHILEHAI